MSPVNDFFGHFHYRITKLTQLPSKVIQGGEWMQVRGRLVSSRFNDFGLIWGDRRLDKINKYVNNLLAYTAHTYS